MRKRYFLEERPSPDALSLVYTRNFVAGLDTTEGSPAVELDVGDESIPRSVWLTHQIVVEERALDTWAEMEKSHGIRYNSKPQNTESFPGRNAAKRTSYATLPPRNFGSEVKRGKGMGFGGYSGVPYE